MLEPIASPQAASKRTGEISQDVVIVNIAPSAVGELAAPIYPADALAAHTGDCTIFVTIVIDLSGNVSEMMPSWQRMNIPNRFSAQFLRAVNDAVGTWRFEPARYVYWEKSGNEELKYLHADKVEARVDIKFTFESSGRVR